MKILLIVHALNKDAVAFPCFNYFYYFKKLKLAYIVKYRRVILISITDDL